jgi:hypothetical protein
VNKTRESRKMAKEVKKQQQQRPLSNDSKVSTTVESSSTLTTVEQNPVIKDANKNTNGEIEITCKEYRSNDVEQLHSLVFTLVKPLQIVANKNSTNSFTSTHADLQVTILFDMSVELFMFNTIRSDFVKK